MSVPVSVWLPGEITPVLAGHFVFENSNGTFTYDSDYLNRRGAMPLDPIVLPLGKRPVREVNQDGIFGIFLDAGPDSWGEFVLERALGYKPSSIDLLVRSGADGTGNLAFGDLQGRLGGKYPDVRSLDPMASYFEALQEGQTPDIPQVVKDLGLDVVTTSLGGATPKITISKDDELWLAKYPLKGDRPHGAAAESAMLSGARALGIRACESEVLNLDRGRSVVLVRRFDRATVRGANGDIAGYARTAYASANTAMRLKKNHLDDPRHSYQNLCDEIQRWCATSDRSATEEKRELWRRIVFNSLIGNGDDHSRNHGLLMGPDGWSLSPAFDLVPHVGGDGHVALAMPYWVDSERRLRKDVSAEGLLQSAGRFGYEQEEAVEVLLDLARKVGEQWRSWLVAAGMPDSEIENRKRSFQMCDILPKQVDALPVPSKNKRSSQRA